LVIIWEFMGIYGILKESKWNTWTRFESIPICIVILSYCEEREGILCGLALCNYIFPLHQS
jgi:hypothetical protein